MFMYKTEKGALYARSVFALARTGIFSLIVLVVSGCALVAEPQSNMITRVPSFPIANEIKELQQAQQEFFTGDYAQARVRYQGLLHQDVESGYGTIARYGLVCIDIATAHDFDTASDAFVRLQEVSQELYALPQDDLMASLPETPLMITEALSALHIEEPECQPGQPEIRYVETKKKPNESVAIQKYKKDIEELKATIKKLEHQISVYEAIDKELQEKRKPL